MKFTVSLENQVKCTFKLTRNSHTKELNEAISMANNRITELNTKITEIKRFHLKTEENLGLVRAEMKSLKNVENAIRNKQIFCFFSLLVSIFLLLIK
jgi:predicted  nucleic acid-binding Zn-ribbon protein